MTLTNKKIFQNLPLVGEAMETYSGTACTGFTKEVLIPSSAAIHSTVAPLLPTGVAQLLVEGGITAVENFIPRYLFEECLTARRAMICGASYQAPYATDAVSGIYNNDVYVPSYPHKNICTAYANSCAPLIAQLPFLAMDCDLELFPGLKLFPETEQVTN